MYRPVVNVAIESIIIGMMNVGIFYSLKYFTKLDLVWLLFITGAMIHIIFEYTGGNKWWCTQTYKT
jgi:hypothetical protein